MYVYDYLYYEHGSERILNSIEYQHNLKFPKSHLLTQYTLQYEQVKAMCYDLYYIGQNGT